MLRQTAKKASASYSLAKTFTAIGPSGIEGKASRSSTRQGARVVLLDAVPRTLLDRAKPTSRTRRWLSRARAVARAAREGRGRPRFRSQIPWRAEPLAGGAEHQHRPARLRCLLPEQPGRRRDSLVEEAEDDLVLHAHCLPRPLAPDQTFAPLLLSANTRSVCCPPSCRTPTGADDCCMESSALSSRASFVHCAAAWFGGSLRLLTRLPMRREDRGRG